MLWWVVKLRIVSIAPTGSTKHFIQPAIVTIATNGFSADKLVNSLRKKGQFDGEIFVVGDKCTPASSKATYLEIDVFTPSGGPGNAARQSAKHLKQRLFEILATARPEGVPQQLLYLDADMEANAPVQALLSRLGTWDPSCSAYMFPERWYAKSRFNGGTMLIDAGYSKGLLDAWKAKLEDHPEFPRDQLALSLVLAQSTEAEFRICRFPQGGVSFAADAATAIRGVRATTFTHWTSQKARQSSWTGRVGCPKQTKGGN